MKSKSNLLFLAILPLLFCSCKCEGDDCPEGHFIRVVSHWTDLPQGVSKPTGMAAFLYPPAENPQYYRTSIHSDGGMIYSEYERNNLLFYNIQEHGGMIFRNLDDFYRAEVILTPYEEGGREYIKEPYFLYGESFADILFLNSNILSLHYTPELLTHVLRLEVVTLGEEAELLTGCTGILSGLANRINLSRKYNEGSYPVCFNGVRFGTTYIKELLHLGYSGMNMLELTFHFQDETTKTVEIDLTGVLLSVAKKSMQCRLTVLFTQDGIEADIKEVTIEPYKYGDSDSIQITN